MRGAQQSHPAKNGPYQKSVSPTLPRRLLLVFIGRRRNQYPTPSYSTGYGETTSFQWSWGEAIECGGWWISGWQAIADGVSEMHCSFDDVLFFGFEVLIFNVMSSFMYHLDKHNFSKPTITLSLLHTDRKKNPKTNHHPTPPLPKTKHPPNQPSPTIDPQVGGNSFVFLVGNNYARHLKKKKKKVTNPRRRRRWCIEVHRGAGRHFVGGNSW